MCNRTWKGHGPFSHGLGTSGSWGGSKGFLGDSKGFLDVPPPALNIHPGLYILYIICVAVILLRSRTNLCLWPSTLVLGLFYTHNSLVLAVLATSNVSIHHVRTVLGVILCGTMYCKKDISGATLSIPGVSARAPAPCPYERPPAPGGSLPYELGRSLPPV